MVPGISVECVCLSGAMLAKAGTVLDVCPLVCVWLGGIDCGRGECVSFGSFLLFVICCLIFTQTTVRIISVDRGAWVLGRGARDVLAASCSVG